MWLDTVRIARDFGTVSELLPPGCVSLLDAPSPLVGVIKTSLVFLSWLDNLPRKEIPPRRIWLDDKKLKRHFDSVEKTRKLEMKGQSNDEGWNDEIKVNDAAKSLLIED